MTGGGRLLQLRAVSLLIAVPFLVASLNAQTGDSETKGDLQKQLNNIAASLANGAVATIDILHIPDWTETRVSVSPDRLEKWFDSRVTINKVSEWSGRDELAKVLRLTELKNDSRMPDLRLAIIFYASDGKKVGALSR